MGLLCCAVSSRVVAGTAGGRQLIQNDVWNNYNKYNYNKYNVDSNNDRSYDKYVNDKTKETKIAIFQQTLFRFAVTTHSKWRYGQRYTEL